MATDYLVESIALMKNETNQVTTATACCFSFYYHDDISSKWFQVTLPVKEYLLEDSHRNVKFKLRTSLPRKFQVYLKFVSGGAIWIYIIREDDYEVVIAFCLCT